MIRAVQRHRSAAPDAARVASERSIRKMFRLLIAAIAAASLSSAASAETKKAFLSPELSAKSATVGEIAAAIAKTGSVRVLVILASPGKSAEQLAVAAHDAATRDAVKREVASTIDTVVKSYKFSHHTSAKGAPAIVRLTSAPAFSALVNEKELAALGKDPRVASIEYDRPVTKHLAVTLPLIGMPAVHSAGGTGVGYTVAHIDDGIQRDHEFLGVGRIVPNTEGCFLDTNNCPNGTNEQTGNGAAAAAAGASHGTHTAGIAIGKRASGTPSKGVATAAKIVPVNIFGPNSSVSFSTIQRAFEYIEDLVLLSGGSNPHKIASLNMSVGGGLSEGICDADPTMALLKPVVDSLRSKGVLPVVSAGNSSHTNGVGFPACISTIVTVAATSRTGVVASYTDINRHTDLFAPGGEVGDCVVSSVPTNAFASLCGTSMAAPHVAGAAAVLKQVKPAASACRIEDALKFTGVATTDTRTVGGVTKPRIRVDLARGRLLAPALPPNNSFASATVIPATATQYSANSSTVSATLETGEPHHVVATSHRSIWWKWTPTTTGPVTIDTIGSGIDTVLAVYRGATSVAGLAGKLIASNDNVSATEKASRATFNATAGQTYHIVVAGKTSSEQCFVALNLTRPPANDDFLGAQAVTVSATTEFGLAGSNVLATKQTGEPDHNGNSGATTSVWYKFVAPVSGPITIDTEGSPTLTDTVLAIYTGTVLNALTPIAADDDSGTGLLSRVSFNMVRGQVYRVAVAGYSGAQGRFRLWFAPAGAQRIDRAKVSFVD
jgi:subtilisin family serine protease